MTRSLLALLFLLLQVTPLLGQDPVAKSEYLFENPPFAECHASTIVELDKGSLLAAWFAGTEEGNKDVEIWQSRLTDGVWSKPISVANGVQKDGSRFPCWNPVLFKIENRLILFYKVGPSPSQWWGEWHESSDNGMTWQPHGKLPESILGPIKNKPLLVKGEYLLCGSSSEEDGWRVHCEIASLDLKSWKREPALNQRNELESIQPTFLVHGPKHFQMLCRSRNAKRITSTESTDGGKSWGKLKTIELPNPNSGIDAVTLADGRHLLVYNHREQDRKQPQRDRAILNVAISKNGYDWKPVAVLEDQPAGEFSYPAVVQAGDSLVHITYTWNRKKIRHVVIDPGKIAVD